MCLISPFHRTPKFNKKLSYRRRIMSVEILSTAVELWEKYLQQTNIDDNACVIVTKISNSKTDLQGHSRSLVLMLFNIRFPISLLLQLCLYLACRSVRVRPGLPS